MKPHVCLDTYSNYIDTIINYSSREREEARERKKEEWIVRLEKETPVGGVVCGLGYSRAVAY